MVHSRPARRRSHSRFAAGERWTRRRRSAYQLTAGNRMHWQKGGFELRTPVESKTAPEQRRNARTRVDGSVRPQAGQSSGVARPFCELGPARTDQVLGVIGRRFDGAVRADVDVPARESLHGPDAGRRLQANPISFRVLAVLTALGSHAVVLQDRLARVRLLEPVQELSGRVRPDRRACPWETPSARAAGIRRAMALPRGCRQSHYRSMRSRVETHDLVASRLVARAPDRGLQMHRRPSLPSR